MSCSEVASRHFEKADGKLQNSGFDSAFLRLQLCELRASRG